MTKAERSATLIRQTRDLSKAWDSHLVARREDILDAAGVRRGGITEAEMAEVRALNGEIRLRAQEQDGRRSAFDRRMAPAA